MIKTTYICDRCGASSESDSTPTPWNRITITLAKYNQKDYLLCGTCLAKLGFLVPEQPEKLMPILSIERRLFEIIEEIVQESLENSLT